MAVFLIATGPALALLARVTEWQADRKQASHSPKIELNPFPWSGSQFAYDRSELESFKARNRGDVSKLQGRFKWRGQPPIV